VNPLIQDLQDWPGEIHVAMTDTYATVEPSRAEVDQLDGPSIVEFGSPTCGYCYAAQPLLASALADYPRVRHVKIADASGRRLGRSYKVKLWPTLVFLSDGCEMARLFRPRAASAIRECLTVIDVLK
jgi:thioredoxin 1